MGIQEPRAAWGDRPGEGLLVSVSSSREALNPAPSSPGTQEGLEPSVSGSALSPQRGQRHCLLLVRV